VTQPTPTLPAPETGANPFSTQVSQGPAAVCNDGGLDLRKFGSLEPHEQLEALERDFSRITSYERDMRMAEAQLDGQATREVKP
jgi:hypothetical protein